MEENEKQEGTSNAIPDFRFQKALLFFFPHLKKVKEDNDHQCTSSIQMLPRSCSTRSNSIFFFQPVNSKRNNESRKRWKTFFLLEVLRGNDREKSQSHLLSTQQLDLMRLLLHSSVENESF